MKQTFRRSNFGLIRDFACIFIGCLCFVQGFAQEVETVASVKGYGPSYAIAMHGDLKYAPDFKHFGYVNPAAPKGGSIKLSALGTFDNYHGFILKGNAADGLALIYDTLMVHSRDEPFSLYGLLAESIEIAPDRTWVEFRLRSTARFQNNTPVEADDVVFTFNALKQHGHPHYRVYYRDVASVEALTGNRVRFHLSDPANPELPMIVAELPVFSRQWWKGRDFAEPQSDFPLGSGPYRLQSAEPGRSVQYARVEDYWGRDLAVNRGMNNFDRVTYEYYRDETVQFEAFKAGEYDFRIETAAKNWATGYDFPAARSGWVKLREQPHGNSAGMQGFAFNLRRPMFADRRVREALALAFDFEWSNRNLFHDAYTRTQSYFANTELASSGMPAGKELALLEPFRKELPPALFTQPFASPVNAGDGQIRARLVEATHLLREAGWQIQKGQLRHRDDGHPFEFEILLVQPMFERVTLPFVRNLERLGIRASIRIVDASQYIRRLDQFDFDMVVASFGQSLSPGNEQRHFWGSEFAEDPGSANLIGITHPVVDALIERVIGAPDREALITATRALDRVLLWQHYIIPHYHIRTFRIAYWNKFGYPDVAPRYDIGILTWWVDADAERQLTELRRKK